MGLISSIKGANNAASAIAKAVTTVAPAKNTSGLDAASVNEVLKDEKEDAEEEVSSSPSSGQVASKATGIFSSNRPASQAPFPVTPTAASPNASQQAAPMPPMGMGGGAGATKVADDLKNLLGQKPNPKNNEPWRGKGAEENPPPKVTPPAGSRANQGIEIEDKKKIAALNEAFNQKNPLAADPRKALLFIYTNAKDKNSESLAKSVADPTNQELLTKHYNPAHIHKDENGKITVNGQALDPKSLIAPLINTKFEKAGAFIIANAGNGKFKESEVEGNNLDTKQLIAVKNSNLHFAETSDESVIKIHLDDQKFMDFLKKNTTKSEKHEDLLANIESYLKPQDPNNPPMEKLDSKAFGESLFRAWKEYINQ